MTSGEFTPPEPSADHIKAMKAAFLLGESIVERHLRDPHAVRTEYISTARFHVLDHSSVTDLDGPYSGFLKNSPVIVLQKSNETMMGGLSIPETYEIDLIDPFRNHLESSQNSYILSIDLREKDDKNPNRPQAIVTGGGVDISLELETPFYEPEATAEFMVLLSAINGLSASGRLKPLTGEYLQEMYFIQRMLERGIVPGPDEETNAF